MARHPLTAGHEVAFWSNQGDKAKQLAKEGNGTAYATPREVAERADFVFYCVGDGTMAQAVTSGPDGLLDGVRPGSIPADCSTISPAISKEIGKAFAAKGAHFLDCALHRIYAGSRKRHA